VSFNGLAGGRYYGILLLKYIGKLAGLNELQIFLSAKLINGSNFCTKKNLRK
jgi:hypothetical protein